MPTTDIDELHEITRAAAEIFTAEPRRRCAITYLRQRGIDATVLAPQWVIGYAPPGWTRLTDTLRGRFPDEALIDAGVARLSSRDTLIDSFRHRVMFGVRDTEGRVCGFIGRDLSGDDAAPKYLNTHQHALYRKSELLYGLYEGTREGVEFQPVVVEGPLDVLAIAARQRTWGKIELLPVAACGTSFTPAHARSVAYATNHQETAVVIAMDGDVPGRAAALAVGDRLRNEQLDARVTALSNGTDPAEFLARPGTSLDAFRAQRCLPLLAIHVEDAIARQGDRMRWIEGRLGALRSVADHLGRYAPDDAARSITWLADTLSLDRDTVTREIVDAYSRRAHWTTCSARNERLSAFLAV